MGAGLNQQAVCEVLAAQAQSDGYDQTPRQLKDRVSRAIGPRPGRISGQTLRWFIDGFAMSPDDAQYLWNASELGSAGVVLLEAKDLGAPPPRDYKTVYAQELHQIGADGVPFEHRTILILEATADTFAFYPFIFSNNVVTSIKMVRGARNVGKPYRLDSGLSAINIRLEDPIPTGHTVSLEYESRFLYSTTPPSHFRRGVHLTGTGLLEICVQFHPDRLPAHVWWSIWAGLDGPVISEEIEPLKSDGSVSRRVKHLSGQLIGFRWAFDGSTNQDPR
jgi:hypothetical protein